MKVAVIGSRGFSDYALLSSTMDWVGNDGYGVLDITEVISGGARGADQLGAQWAREKGVKLTEYLPDWDRHGKAAGFIRNEDIVKGADMVVAFWGPDPKTGELSRGTANSLSIAKRLKKTTVIVYF